MRSVAWRSASFNRWRSSRRGSSVVCCAAEGSVHISSSSSLSRTNEGVGVRGRVSSSQVRLYVGIASHTAGVDNAFGKATGEGLNGPVPKVSNHGPSPSKVDGDKERKELSRTVRLAITKVNNAISDNQVKERC